MSVTTCEAAKGSVQHCQHLSSTKDKRSWGMSSSLFIKRHYAASRTRESLEYLETPSHSTEEVTTEQLGPDLATHLLEAGALVRTYEETGVADSLDRATEILHSASSKMPDEDRRLGAILSNYEAVIDIRFVGTGEIDGKWLGLAVEVAERAVLVTPQDHPCWVARLSSLSSWLGRRFDWHSCSPADMNLAVEKAELAAKSSSVDDGSRLACGIIWDTGSSDDSITLET